MDALEDSMLKPNNMEGHFIDDTASQKSSQDDGLIDNVLDKAKHLKDVVVKESKTLVPDVKKTFDKSSTRLNSEKRIIDIIPNSYLYYTLVALGVIYIVKKL